MSDRKFCLQNFAAFNDMNCTNILRIFLSLCVHKSLAFAFIKPYLHEEKAYTYNNYCFMTQTYLYKTLKRNEKISLVYKFSGHEILIYFWRFSI